MKFQTAAFLSAIVATASLASASDCTPAQLASLDASSNETAAFATACPALFDDGTEVLDLTDTSSFTKEALEAIAPCKAPACTAYLTQLTGKAPDCSVIGINVKSVYGAVLTLCKKFANGTVDNKELTQIFEGVIGNATSLLEGAFGNMTDSSSMKDNSTSTGNSTSTATTPTSLPDKEDVPAASSVLPTPTPTPTPAKSSSNYLTGLAAIATAGVVSAFLI